MTSLAFVFVNESSAPELTHDALVAMAGDIQLAYDRDFATAWGALPVTLAVAATEADAPSDVRMIRVIDNDPSVPDALAYHSVDAKGNPTLYVLVDAIRTQGGVLIDEIAKAASHEIFEASRNPFVSLFCMVAGKPALLCFEVADPVQGDSYRVNATAVSNFVLPAYFDAEDGEGPYDQLASLKAPLTCAPGGYQSWSDGSNTFGEKVSASKRVEIQKHGRVAAARGAGSP